ncbi:hypothetical protein DPMN_089152 [Dreissena polymorpha]|uniref:DUF7587 domain-containing protein n=1 Tax=Dreissena polymorpha TaxID=45954 RepID=A0A9D4KVV3_DREPO|nr:hypothetical protein DPMN_089152 [Dreissena polymorpha]
MYRLYRLLRDDERPELFGIRAKDPNARLDLTEHVQFGSRRYYQSQFISCTETLNGVIELGKSNIRHGYSNRIRIAVIDPLKMVKTNGIKVYDSKALQCLKTSRARQNAKKYDEVVIEGIIAPDCICEVISVEQMGPNILWPFFQYVRLDFMTESALTHRVICMLLGCPLPLLSI